MPTSTAGPAPLISNTATPDYFFEPEMTWPLKLFSITLRGVDANDRMVTARVPIVAHNQIEAVNIVQQRYPAWSPVGAVFLS